MKSFEERCRWSRRGPDSRKDLRGSRKTSVECSSFERRSLRSTLDRIALSPQPMREEREGRGNQGRGRRSDQLSGESSDRKQ